METYLLHLLICLALMLLIGYLIERHGVLIIIGLVLFGILLLYLPPEKLNNFFNKEKEKTTTSSLPKDARVNKPPRIDFREEGDSEREKIVYILVPERVNDNIIVPKVPIEYHVSPTPSSPEEPSLKNISIDCRIEQRLIGQLVAIEVLVGQEGNAINRVEELNNNGFPEAFYIFLLCFKSRIPDKENLFAIILGQPCKTVSTAKKMYEDYRKRAKENNIELHYDEKIIKLEAKDHLVSNVAL